MNRIFNSLFLFVVIISLGSCNREFPLQENLEMSKLHSESLPLAESDSIGNSIIEEEIVPSTIDTTSIVFQKMLAKARGKLRSTTSELKSGSGINVEQTLFDLRDSPVNIIVNENVGQGNYLTAKRNRYKRWFKTYYSNAPARLENKQDDSNTNSQTFYLTYVPLIGQYTIKTKFEDNDYYMIPGSYKSSPNDEFLYGEQNCSNEYIKIFNFIPSDSNGESFRIENFKWSYDESNSSVFSPALGCNNDSRTYFEKYWNSRRQEFKIAPIEDFEMERIEFHNDYSAVLSKQPDFVVTWTSINKTNVNQQLSTNFGKTASRTSSFSRSNSFSLSVTAGLDISIPFVADGSIKTTASNTHTATWGKSETFQDTRNYNFQIVVPAMRKIIAKAQVTRYLIKMHYTAYLKGTKTGKIIRVNGIWEGVDCTDIVTSYTEYDLKTNQLVATRLVYR